MYSNVYAGAIRFCENNEDCFITDAIDPQLHNHSTKPLSEGHPDAIKYVKAISRLFSEITINESNLWIIPTLGTSSVRVYFSGKIFTNLPDPLVYPVSHCCDKCVYVDIEMNLNGSIICPFCKTVLASFIHYTKEGGQIGDLDQIDKHALFRQKKRQSAIKNRLMYENLTSNKFKTKNLKKVLMNHSKLSQQSFKLNTTGDSATFKKTTDQSSKPDSGKQPIKDGFILQIKSSSVKQNRHHQQTKKYFGINTTVTNKTATSQSKYEQETKRGFDHQLSIQETKRIILNIFR